MPEARSRLLSPGLPFSLGRLCTDMYMSEKTFMEDAVGVYMYISEKTFMEDAVGVYNVAESDRFIEFEAPLQREIIAF